MTAAAIVKEAMADGVSLALSPAGTIKATGKQAAVDRWLSVIREHKAEILAAIERHDDAEDLREAFEERAKNAKAEGVDLTSLLTEACQGVEGIDAATFRSLLSPEDIEDIEGGHIPANTLNAYARSFAEGIRCGRITVLAKAILTSRVRCNAALRAGHHRRRLRDRGLQDRRRRDRTEVPGTMGERRT